MDRKSTILTARLSRRTRPGGFSFTEVLFAVMLLGIGFIMVAALFPAAISQTQSAVNEAEGSSVCTDGINFLKSLGATYNGPGGWQRPTAGPPLPAYSGSWQFPQTFLPGLPPPNGGRMFMAINTPTWGLTETNLAQPAAGSPFINSADPRFGWIPFYRRSAGDPFAQVIVVAVQNQNQTVTDANFPFANTNGLFTLGNANVVPVILPNLPVVPGATTLAVTTTPGLVQPTLTAELDFNYQGDGTSLARIVNQANSTNSSVPWAAPGAFLIVADDPYAYSTTGVVPLNGRVFRLGQQLLVANLPSGTIPNPTGESDFQLVPGFDLKDASENRPDITHQLNVFVIGRPAYLPTGQTTYVGSSTGLAQDVAFQTAVIRVK